MKDPRSERDLRSELHQFAALNLDQLEVRIYFGIYALLLHGPFKAWMCDQLDLPRTATFYLPRHQTFDGVTDQPDFFVRHDGRDIAFIEVEREHNEPQFLGYVARYPDLKAIRLWGRREYSCELSLEDVREELQRIDGSATGQLSVMLRFVLDNLNESLTGRRRGATPRIAVPADVLLRPYVARIIELLSRGDPYRVVQTDAITYGKVGMHSHSKGFSINLKACPPTKSVNVFNQKKDAPFLYFPKESHHSHYLRDREAGAVRRLTEFVAALPGEELAKEKRVPLAHVERTLEEITELVLDLV